MLLNSSVQTNQIFSINGSVTNWQSRSTPVSCLHTDFQKPFSLWNRRNKMRSEFAFIVTYLWKRLEKIIEKCFIFISAGRARSTGPEVVFCPVVAHPSHWNVRIQKKKKFHISCQHFSPTKLIYGGCCNQSTHEWDSKSCWPWVEEFAKQGAEESRLRAHLSLECCCWECSRHDTDHIFQFLPYSRDVTHTVIPNRKAFSSMEHIVYTTLSQLTLQAELALCSIQGFPYGPGSVYSSCWQHLYCLSENTSLQSVKPAHKSALQVGPMAPRQAELQYSDTSLFSFWAFHFFFPFDFDSLTSDSKKSWDAV